MASYQNYYQMDDIALAQTSGREELLNAKQTTKQPHLQSDLYQISGNSYTILQHLRKMDDHKQYKYLKINVAGHCLNSFNYGCFYFLIITIVLFFFPIFLMCTDCCKRKIYNLFNIDLNVYEAMSRIIAEIRPSECYIVIQDTFFNEAKCNAIGRGLEQSHTLKFQLVNTSKGFNTYGHNYTDFPVYAKQIKQTVQKAKCRWEGYSI